MTPAASPRAAAESAEIVIVMVTNTPSCEAVMAGPDGVHAGLRPGTLAVDTGTTQVSATTPIAAAVEAAGCTIVDPPDRLCHVGSNTADAVCSKGTSQGSARGR